MSDLQEHARKMDEVKLTPGKWTTRGGEKVYVTKGVNKWLIESENVKRYWNCKDDGRFWDDNPTHPNDLITPGWPLKLKVGKWYRAESGNYFLAAYKMPEWDKSSYNILLLGRDCNEWCNERSLYIKCTGEKLIAEIDEPAWAKEKA